MFELPEIIVDWLDNNNYPPIYSSLPPQLLLPGLFCENVRFWLIQSEAQQRECGSVIFLQRNPVAQLALGDIIKGEKNRINTESSYQQIYQQHYSLLSSCPVGTFHTHPGLDRAISAPSLRDFINAHWLVRAYNTMFFLVVSPPIENPWFYLTIGTKEMSLCHMDKTIFTACVKAYRSQQIMTVKNSIKKEMSHYTNDPSVSKLICAQIAQDRTLSHVSTLYKAGFYSGQNGFLTLRNTIS